MAIRNPELKKMAKERDHYFPFDLIEGTWAERLKSVESHDQLGVLFTEYFKLEPGLYQKFTKYIELGEQLTKKAYFPIPNSKSYGHIYNPFLFSYQKREPQRAQVRKTKIVKDKKIDLHFEDDGSAKTIAGGSINYEKFFPKFSRPVPNIPSEISKELNISLNLALSTEDIMSYVEIIKKTYDKSNGEFYKSASTISDIVTIDKVISTIQIKVKKKGSKTNLEMPEKSQQEIYADLFFLYDLFTDGGFKKRGDAIDYFRSEMIDYYAAKVCKYHRIKDIDEVSEYIGTPRDQSIREYYKIMQHYIDDYGYKKLIA